MVTVQHTQPKATSKLRTAAELGNNKCEHDVVVIDVFTYNGDHQIYYKTLSWLAGNVHHLEVPSSCDDLTYEPSTVSELSDDGMLSIPGALAVIVVSQLLFRYLGQVSYIAQGIVPGVILTVFLGTFGLYTAKMISN